MERVWTEGATTNIVSASAHLHYVIWGLGRDDLTSRSDELLHLLVMPCIYTHLGSPYRPIWTSHWAIPWRPLGLYRGILGVWDSP